MNKIIYSPSSWSKILIQKCTKRENFGAVEHPELIGGNIFYGRMDGKSSLNISKIVRYYLTNSKIFKRRFTKYTDDLIKNSK